MQIEKININEIKEYKKNAKIHTENQIDKIKESIINFGYNDPIAIDENNEIIEGHGRLKALKQITNYKDKDIDIIKLTNLTEPQKKAYRIAHNKLNLDTGFDFDILKEEFHDLEDTDFFDSTGFDSQEISNIWDETNEDNFDQEKALKDPKYKAQICQIWQLGNHRLMCGDATIKENVSALMGQKKADMVFTDPPYNVNICGGGAMPLEKQSKIQQEMAKSKNKRTIENDNMSREEFRVFTNEYLSRYLENCDGPYYIFMSCKECGTIMESFERLGGHWSSTIIWNKSNFVLSRKDYHPKFEPILYGWKEGEKIKHLDQRDESDVWEFDKPHSSKLHPTMKPLELCGKAIKNSSNKDNIVLDLFGGSGSTLISCEQTNRKCYMMELDPIYCSVIIERWEKLTNKKAEKIEQAKPKIKGEFPDY